MEKRAPGPLESTDTLTIARELSDRQIAIIRENAELGGKDIADHLESLRNAVWGSKTGKVPASEDKQKEVFEDVIKNINETQKEQLLSSYARMGHLYDIASISARSNYLNNLKNEGKIIPGGVEELINANGHESLEKLIEKLNQPVFEVVMTAHPTNVNSVESMKAQREIAKAIGTNNEDAVKSAILQYQKTPILHQVNSEDANLTVRDETKTTLYFLGNLYEDLPKAYKNYDDALQKYAVRKGSNYDPTELKLKTKFGSWGSSGDKDGNNNVTAETTLEAIALHTQAILTRYSKDLGTLNLPELAKWKTGFDGALSKLSPLVKNIEQLRIDAQKIEKDKNSTPTKLNRRFDELSGKLATIRNSLDKKGFEEDLEIAAKTNKEALNLLRRFRTFSFNFSKIEYRETAKEYSRVVGELMDGYEELTSKQKIERLTDLLERPSNVAAQFYTEKKSKIISGGAGKPYIRESSGPIAYHTLKRMALARDFSDMIKDNVLAECGQVELPPEKKRTLTEAEVTNQGIVNILEAQFLQKAVEIKGKDGKEHRPILGIVPLFEEPDTMDYIEKIIGAVYENPAYKQHLQVVKEANGEAKLTQQIMIAHSDNARRSGLQAARAYIHEAHRKMRTLNKERKEEGKDEIKIQFFEGGSISDAYRNGVRAVSATVNAFGLHDFAKFTYQGGDLLNYFNHPDSPTRSIDCHISHQAKCLEKNANGEWVNKARDINGRSPHEGIENNVTIALKKTLDDYKKNDFTEETMGVLLAALNYDKVIKDSNSGSRAGSRFAQGSKAQLGAVISKPVRIDGIRTIGFSKAWQGSGIVPSWIGSLHLIDYLNNVNMDRKINKVSFTTLQHERELNASNLKIIFDKSPTFRDAQDRSAFALALTDMDAATKIANDALDINDKLDINDNQIFKNNGKTYLERIKKTYEAAAKLTYASHTGKELFISNLNNRQIRDKMIEALPNLQGDIINKTNYRAFLLYLQIHHSKMLEDAHIGRTAQSAKDTVEHSIWLGASDPTFAKHKAQNAGRNI